MLNTYPLFLFFPNAPCQPHLSNNGNELDFDFKTIAGTNNDLGSYYASILKTTFTWCLEQAGRTCQKLAGYLAIS